LGVKIQKTSNCLSLSSFAFDFLKEVKQKKGRSSSKILPLFSALLRALFKQRDALRLSLIRSVSFLRSFERPFPFSRDPVVVLLEELHFLKSAFKTEKRNQSMSSEQKKSERTFGGLGRVRSTTEIFI